MTDEKPTAKTAEPVVEQTEEEVEETVSDPGAFPGQNPGRLIVLPADPLGTQNYQAYVDGRLPEAE